MKKKREFCLERKIKKEQFEEREQKRMKSRRVKNEKKLETKEKKMCLPIVFDKIERVDKLLQSSNIPFPTFVTLFGNSTFFNLLQLLNAYSSIFTKF